MHYRRLGRTDLQVSEISLGALEIGRDWGIKVEGDFGRPEEQDAIRLVETAIDQGINFLDTAPAYQLSEERLGKVLVHHRGEVYIGTKVGEHYSDAHGFWYDSSPMAVRASIEQSLHRLGIDTIDLLQIHSASLDIIDQGEVLAEMQRFQQAGHVRFLGMSGGNNEALAAIENGSYDTVQVVFNILDQGAAQTVFPEAEKCDVGVIIMLPVGQGILTAKRAHLEPEDKRRRQAEALEGLERPGQTLAQAALRFVLASKAVSTAIAGTRKVDHLLENFAASGTPLTDDDMALVTRLWQQELMVFHSEDRQ